MVDVERGDLFCDIGWGSGVRRLRSAAHGPGLQRHECAEVCPGGTNLDPNSPEYNWQGGNGHIGVGWESGLREYLLVVRPSTRVQRVHLAQLCKRACDKLHNPD